MTRHVRTAVADGTARFLNPMSGDQTLHLDVVLPLRDPAGLDRLVREIGDPSSSSYRQFLTVSDFTARFGRLYHSPK